jgi:hypothetical protein
MEYYYNLKLYKKTEYVSEMNFKENYQDFVDCNNITNDAVKCLQKGIMDITLVRGGRFGFYFLDYVTTKRPGLVTNCHDYAHTIGTYEMAREQGNLKGAILELLEHGYEQLEIV